MDCLNKKTTTNNNKKNKTRNNNSRSKWNTDVFVTPHEMSLGTKSTWLGLGKYHDLS